MKKAKPPASAAVQSATLVSAPTAAWTLEERVHRIEALGEKVTGYIRFMCQIGSLNGASSEVKDKAVAAFYEQLVLVERQLGRVYEILQLE